MRKVCPKCSNLADKNDRICYYCGHPIVGIQENNLELAKDIKMPDIEENTLPNKIYRSVIDDEIEIGYSKYFLNLYLPIGIIFLIINIFCYLKEAKGFNFYLSFNSIFPIILALFFIVLNYIQISSKKKIMLAFLFSLALTVLNLNNINFINYIFLKKYLLYPYDLEKLNLNYFFYSFFLFSFLSSVIKNKKFYTIFFILSLISIIALFIYNKDLKLNKSLIYTLFISNNIYWFLFRIIPLIISIYMLFVKRDIYFRIILQFFLIIFILINFYSYIKYLNYSSLNIIFSLSKFSGFILNIYLLISLAHGVFLISSKKEL